MQGHRDALRTDFGHKVPPQKARAAKNGHSVARHRAVPRRALRDDGLAASGRGKSYEVVVGPLGDTIYPEMCGF